MSTTRRLAKPLLDAARFQFRQHTSKVLSRTIILHASSKHDSRSHLSTSTTSRASLASSLPSQPTILLYQPKEVDIAKEDLDVDFLPPERVKLEITDRAAEVHEILTFRMESIHPHFLSN
jgi:hypothetical protein